MWNSIAESHAVLTQEEIATDCWMLAKKSVECATDSNKLSVIVTAETVNTRQNGFQREVF